MVHSQCGLRPSGAFTTLSDQVNNLVKNMERFQVFVTNAFRFAKLMKAVFH